MILKMLFFFAAASFPAWFLLFAGVGTRRDSRRRSEQEYTRTTGVIVDYVRGEMRTGRSGGHFYWKPVIEFTAEGQSFHLEYGNMMNREKYPDGKEVDLLYDVCDPTHFHLAEDTVFTDPGGGAIRIALIWIIASAALSIGLAVFVGGARFDFHQMWWDLQRFFRR